MDTRNKQTVLVGVMLGFLLVALIGAYTAYISLFPFAEPMDAALPKDILSVSVCQRDGVETVVSDAAALLALMADAEPTRTMSVNDYPTAAMYYTVFLQTNEWECRYFIYEDHGTVYIEIPYGGVYRAEGELLALVQSLTTGE